MTEEAMPETVEVPVSDEQTEDNALAPQVDEGEEAPESEPQETQEDEEPEWFKKRFAKITAQKHEARALAEQTQQELERERESRRQLEQRLALIENPLPDVNNFSSLEDYQAAMVAHFEAKAPKQEPKPQQQTLDPVVAQKAQQIWQEGVNTIPGFEEAMAQAYIPANVANVLVDVPQAALVATHLAKNPAVAYEVAALTPTAAAIKLGQISSTLSATKPKSTKAPPPPKPNKGGSDASSLSPEKMTADEYHRWRLANRK